MNINKKNIANSMNIIIALAAILWLLQWIEIEFFRGNYKPFFSDRFINYNFDSFLFDTSFFVFPILFFLLYKKRKFAYDALLFYSIYFCAVLLFYLIFMTVNSRIFSFEFDFLDPRLLLEFPGVKNLILVIATFVLIRQKNKFKLGKTDVLLIVLSSVVLVLFIRLSIFKVYVYLVVFSILMLIAVLISDSRTVVKLNKSGDSKMGIWSYIKQKSIITLLPFLVLLPWFGFLNDLLLGSPHSLSDHMWSNHYYTPSNYYHSIEYLFYCLPALIAYCLYYLKSRSMPHLKQFKINFYFSVMLNYLLMYLLILLYSLSKMFENY